MPSFSDYPTHPPSLSFPALPLSESQSTPANTPIDPQAAQARPFQNVARDGSKSLDRCDLCERGTPCPFRNAAQHPDLKHSNTVTARPIDMEVIYKQFLETNKNTFAKDEPPAKSR
ncbi:uncharacterized protein PAC_02017 [Phialocephala subalpina]|uniref:Uncharacterized protein n=1 Tax=Phialocephala subalpina TaxID=576137 RepID=A0A1L7WH89_9HELO|nr:uncharacterized protein PAC_02017 [Phialocephala subalpina]